jgi:hypothetical protein
MYRTIYTHLAELHPYVIHGDVKNLNLSKTTDVKNLSTDLNHHDDNDVKSLSADATPTRDGGEIRRNIPSISSPATYPPSTHPDTFIPDTYPNILWYAPARPKSSVFLPLLAPRSLTSRYSVHGDSVSTETSESEASGTTQQSALYQAVTHSPNTLKDVGGGTAMWEVNEKSIFWAFNAVANYADVRYRDMHEGDIGYEPGLFTLFGKLLTQFRRGYYLRENMYEMYSIS